VHPNVFRLAYRHFVGYCERKLCELVEALQPGNALDQERHTCQEHPMLNDVRPHSEVLEDILALKLVLVPGQGFGSRHDRVEEAVGEGCI